MTAASSWQNEAFFLILGPGLVIFTAIATNTRLDASVRTPPIKVTQSSRHLSNTAGRNITL